MIKFETFMAGHSSFELRNFILISNFNILISALCPLLSSLFYVALTASISISASIRSGFLYPTILYSRPSGPLMRCV